ncbi:MAG: hypothetical protein ACR2QG_00365 [Gammaproteobacteria bacterium]
MLVLVVACSTQEPQEPALPDILLVQMQDFDKSETDSLVNYLKMQHGLDVKWIGPLDFQPVMYVPARDQYLAGELARVAMNVVRNKGVDAQSTTVIVLTHKDINSREFRLRYLMAAHFEENNVSVVSTARIDPVNYGQPSDRQLTRERLHKLINKSIGLHHYGYPMSRDMKSVMFGPVGSPQELDQVGDWYAEVDAAEAVTL